MAVFQHLPIVPTQEVEKLCQKRNKNILEGMESYKKKILFIFPSANFSICLMILLEASIMVEIFFIYYTTSRYIIDVVQRFTTPICLL